MNMMQMKIIATIVFTMVFSCTSEEGQMNEQSAAHDTGEVNLDPLDIPAIENALGGMTGTENNGEYKVTVPQNDLEIMVDGFQIIPPMGLGSWVAFTPSEHGAVLMGDVVLLGDEIGPVQQVLIEQGLTPTGIHNHFMRDNPSVMYMHIGGSGSEEVLARGVKAIFDKIAELRGGNPADGDAAEVENSLDTDRIAEILGHEGEMNRGVYKITIGRPDVDLRAHGVSVSTFMGFNTWASWQGTPENAAVAGDFTMLADEVEPVIQALVENGIEVVALHNHMIHEEPHIFFLHYWGTGNFEELANGLREALDQTGTAHGTS